ncbi:MAG: hypothetical protein Q9204_004085 [Flavoplaca sp. TL-2023a]
MAKAVFSMKPEASERKVEVLAMSDAYVGMVWRVGDVEVPGAPTGNGEHGKKKKEMTEEGKGAMSDE